MSDTGLNRLLAAIAGDDAGAVRALLKADSGLATRLVENARLYDSGIVHWLYAGDTALHLAAAGYRTEIVRLLIASGADPNAARSRRRSSPLHYAADGLVPDPAWDEKRQVATIRCLMRHGADIGLQDANGATPLHRAVRTRCAAAVRLLLRAGSDPEKKNKAGSTAFHLAVLNTGRGGSGAPAAIGAQREIIRAFLAHGVRPDLKNARGRTVADSARSEWIRDALA